MLRVFIIFFSVCVAIVVGGCHAGGDASAPVEAQTDHLPCSLQIVGTLNFRRVAEHLFVDGLINDKPTALMFDTGAFETIVTPEAAARLGLHQEKERIGYRLDSRITGIGGERTTALYSANSVQIGQLRGNKWRFLVADLGMSRLAPGADGTLGSDILWNFDIDLDFPESKIVLYAPHHDCSAPSAYLHGNLYQVPLIRPVESLGLKKLPPVLRNLLAHSPPPEPWPRLELTIGGKTLVAVLDTGAPHTTLFRSGAVKLGLGTDAVKPDPHLMVGGVGPHEVGAVRHVAEPIRIGDLEISHVPMFVVDTGGLPGVDMLIGLDVLAYIHVWISHSSSSLIMQYPAASSPQVESGVQG
jgi:predicted aspartyl protease